MSTALAPATADDAPPPSPRAAEGRRRIEAVDFLRGLVIVLMLIDHTREFVHRDAAVFQPTDLARTTIPLFFTRWITHFCAPVFVLLAGTGAALYGARGRSRGELARFLVTRGLWLIVVEFTLVRFGMAFDFDYRAFPGLLEVIWAIGACMILLAALVRLPTAVIAATGAAIVLLHDLADGVRAQAGAAGPDALGALWMVLHQPGFIRVLGVSLLVAYPLLPWLGVMLLGYALGTTYAAWDPARRQRLLVRLGVAACVAFVVLRATNLYGDPAPWAVQPRAAFTVLSFLNTTKYPPSLLFLLMTLGPALLLLAWLERAPGATRAPLGRALVTFGRVPLFFFVLQWLPAHGLAIVLSLVAGRSIAHLFGMPNAIPPAPGAGFGLATTYGVWLVGLALVYPLCRWYAEVKRRRTDWWLSYL